MSIDVGDQAPDFELEGTEGPFKLSDHRGERVILLFYPGDDTTVCTKQFCDYRDRDADVSALDATMVGISTKDLSSKEKFRDKYNLTVPLLADADSKVADLYGVKSKLGGFTKRAVFIIDSEGKVAHKHMNPMSLTYDDVDDLKNALAGVS
jgi:peroxiredoxin Q/BCP